MKHPKYFLDMDGLRELSLRYDKMEEGDKPMVQFRTEYANLKYEGIDGEMCELDGILTGRDWGPTRDDMTLEFEALSKPKRYDGMKELREPVYFMDSGQMIQATWGLIIHYVWEYTGDLKVFTEYTEDMVWKELEELDIIRYSEYDYTDYIAEVGVEQVEFWIVNEDDKIEQIDYYEYEMFHMP